LKTSPLLFQSAKTATRSPSNPNEDAASVGDAAEEGECEAEVWVPVAEGEALEPEPDAEGATLVPVPVAAAAVPASAALVAAGVPPLV